MSHIRVFSVALSVMAVLAAFAEGDVVNQPGVSPGPGVRYATDAYPGFDNEDLIVKPEKKTPRWLGFIFGPKMDNARDQFAWCQRCESEGSWGKARRGYDALVRAWPSSAEAPKAQQRLAEILLAVDADYEEAFAEYRYLTDFYSLECDFDATVRKMYQIAELMRQEGKTIVFFRFRNTVDVRRAYEALVLRSPGADFTPKAMLTIASLRVDEGRLSEAVKVYENLRNLHAGSPEALKALHDEAIVRMDILKMHGYNRLRVRDTADFLKQAIRSGPSEEYRADFERWLTEVDVMMADDAYRAAQFYDSRTRTVRSAINAYERFIEDYPTSPHAEEARSRLKKLREKEGK